MYDVSIFLAIVPGKPKTCLQENLVDCADCGGLPCMNGSFQRLLFHQNGIEFFEESIDEIRFNVATSYTLNYIAQYLLLLT